MKHNFKFILCIILVIFSFSLVPVAAEGNNEVIAVSGNVFLKSDGTVWRFIALDYAPDKYGIIGECTKINPNKKINGMEKIKSISSDNYYTLALKRMAVFGNLSIITIRKWTNVRLLKELMM